MGGPPQNAAQEAPLLAIFIPLIRHPWRHQFPKKISSGGKCLHFAESLCPWFQGKALALLRNGSAATTSATAICFLPTKCTSFRIKNFVILNLFRNLQFLMQLLNQALHDELSKPSFHGRKLKSHSVLSRSKSAANSLNIKFPAQIIFRERSPLQRACLERLVYKIRQKLVVLHLNHICPERKN